jgi:hypothetical protein
MIYRLEPSIDNLELSHNLFNNEMLLYTEQQLIIYLCYLLDQQIGNKNDVTFISDPGDDVLPVVTCIICKDSSMLVTVQEGEMVSRIEMSKGDLLVFPSELRHQFESNQNIIVVKVPYFKKLETSRGPNKYKVTSRLIDEYEIIIYANSEDEARDIAKNTSISKWKHLDLFPEISDRKIIRYSKWGNFNINPID